MTAPDFEALAQAGIRRLRAYDPGLDLVALRRSQPPSRSLVELGSNESALGCSPAARAAMLASVDELHRYPDPLGGDLKRALSSQLGVAVPQLLLGNGSHELLMMLAQVFTGPGQAVLASQYGFAVYALAAQAAGADLRVAPALPAGQRQARGHDLSALAAAVDARTRLVYLANPNNPTGTWFATADLRAFLEAVPRDVLVVVDEAYIEFVTDVGLVSAVSLLADFPNLAVTRTFSKAHGLAGLRVGYLVAHEQWVAVMERVRESFNVNGPGLAACTAAVGDIAHIEVVREANRAEREWLAGELRRRGLSVGVSQTNFLLADFGRPGKPVEDWLVSQGVVPRPMAGYGLPQCLRLTVATRDENRALLRALDTAP